MRSTSALTVVIVIAQFFCTSVWFAGNSVVLELTQNYSLSESYLNYITSSIQLGFILGTLVFAAGRVSDKYSPSAVFCLSALVAALSNLAIIWEFNNGWSVLVFRFVTGFFLAGIYPVGMKIASDYHQKGLGKSLGFLVGALVLGTASPFLIKAYSAHIHWEYVFILTSILSGMGGLMVYLLVPDGPYRKQGPSLQWNQLLKLFKNTDLRKASYGYIGHMFELYTFWALVPVILIHYQQNHPSASLNGPLLSFWVIGIGALGCVLSGLYCLRIGLKKTAMLSLFVSAMCCLAFPWVSSVDSTVLFIGFLMVWGISVVADSPILSSLIAQSAEPALRGTSITIVTCLGFVTTVLSIQLVDFLTDYMSFQYVICLLALGPIFGMVSLAKEP